MHEYAFGGNVHMTVRLFIKTSLKAVSFFVVYVSLDRRTPCGGKGKSMHNNSTRIAFYGKGGIGKSTVASNISVSLARAGKRVLHIGCDPKSDSTRTLMGRRIPTVLDVLREKEQITVDDILFKSSSGVFCVEAGGPEAGNGCAGKAISIMAGQLCDLQVFEQEWDVIIYDVLGDVVCGGFAIPMREHFVDRVYIVTSSEFMSLYAANNILRSIVRFQEVSGICFGGLIYNQRSWEKGANRIEQFARMTHSKIVSTVTHSEAIEKAQYQGKTAVECFPDHIVAREFSILASEILDKCPVNRSTPLSDIQMDEFCNQFVT